MKRILILLLYVISNILVAGAQVPTNGLVAYYPFNGNANDESGNSKHGTGNNVVSVVDRFGVAGKAYQFDGTSWISVAGHPDFDFTSSLTFSLWVLFDQHNPPYGYRLIDKQTPGSPDGYTFDTQGDGSGSNMRFCPGPCEVNGVAKSFLPTQQWVHLSVTYNSGIVRFYVNGRFVHEGHVSATIPINEFPLTFGKTAINSESYAEYNFKGRLDDIRIYNRALASDEITQLYNSEVPVIDLRDGLLAHFPMDGNANDVSGNMNHGVLKGPKPSRDKTGVFGKAYSFDGIDDEIYVDPSKLPTSMSAITISGWFKPKAYSVTNSNWIPILERSNGADNGMFVLALSESNNALYANLQDKFYYAIKPNNVQLNEWHFIAVSISQDKQFFFLDGEFYAMTGVTQNQYNPNQPLIIGRTPAGNNEIYNGDLDDIRIYNRALTFTEIELLYRRGNTECTRPTPQIISSQVSPETNSEGKLPIAANVESCPTSNPIVQFKYWFDGEVNKAKLFETNRSNYLNFALDVTCAALAEGQHTISFQFKGKDDTFSDIFFKTFLRRPITTEIISAPSITVNKGKVEAGGIINIKGIGYTPNGLAQLAISTNGNSQIRSTKSVNINADGSFEAEETIPQDAESGIGLIEVTDLNNQEKTASVKIYIINATAKETPPIKIISPIQSSALRVGETVTLEWQDMRLESLKSAIGQNDKTAKVQYSYLVELAYGNEAWEKVGVLTQQAIPIEGTKTNLSISYILSKSGHCRFRITDLQVNNRTAQSDELVVSEAVSKPHSISFHWANSGKYARLGPIKGIVADGVARFLIEIRFPQNMVPTQVRIDLFNDRPGSTTQYLGKVIASDETEVSEYSEAANSAASITAIQSKAADADGTKWYFWYVAPDDFLQPGDNPELGERIVNFRVSTNGSSIFPGREIHIVRPPLMMVHGLGGNPVETWKHTAYNYNGIPIYFRNAGDVFKAGIYRPQMHPTDCFIRNAKRLLNLDDRNCENDEVFQFTKAMSNSLIYVVQSAMERGYVCSRVDYMCHSMGGVMIRAAINWNDDYYYADGKSPSNFKNYGKGYVNKLITINTPHWGSPWADMADDILKETYSADEKKLQENEEVFKDLFASDGNSFIEQDESSSRPRYRINKALDNMQFFDGGISLNETLVRNHVIYGEIGSSHVLTNAAFSISEWKLLNVVQLHKDYFKQRVAGGAITVFENNLNLIFNRHYDVGTSEFLRNSDLIVSSESQKSGGHLRATSSVSRFEGFTARHTGTFDPLGKLVSPSIVSNIEVGDRVLEVLNSPISSDVFADKLDANPNIRGSSRLSKVTPSGGVNQNGAVVLGDSKVQIVTPLSNDIFSGDTLLPVQVSVSDTIGLRYIRLFFQGEFYYSSFKTFSHTFRLPIRPRFDERKIIFLTGVYDSAGITTYHTDTVGIVVATKPTLAGISAFLDRSFISKGDTIIPFVDAITSEGVIRLHRKDTAIAIRVLDTTIAKVTSSGSRIAVHSRTGSTRAIIAYQGFEDTIILAHNDFYELTEQSSYCPGTDISLVAGFNGAVNRRWQIDNGADFIDLSNGNGLQGVTSDTLVISNSDSTLFGRKFRCIASVGSNEFISQTFTIRFVSKWLGAVSGDWNEPANWSCGNAPQYFSDVVITSGAKFMPKVNSSISLNSLEIEEGANIQIEASAKITLLSKQFD